MDTKKSCAVFSSILGTLFGIGGVVYYGVNKCTKNDKEPELIEDVFINDKAALSNEKHTKHHDSHNNSIISDNEDNSNSDNSKNEDEDHYNKIARKYKSNFNTNNNTNNNTYHHNETFEDANDFLSIHSILSSEANTIIDNKNKNEITQNNCSHTNFNVNMSSNFKDEFICPITNELMKNPVMTKDGITYEKEAIMDWLKKNSSCPVTRKPLCKEDLFPNYSLKRIIEKIRAKQNLSIRTVDSCM